VARRWRRTKWTAVAVVGALGVTAFTGPTASGAPAQTGELAPGYGNARAYGVRLNPTTAQLSLAITNGISLASHQNQVATAEARAIDLGIIGATMAAEGCDGGDPTLPKDEQPQPLRTTSTEEGSSEGKTEQEDVPPGTPVTKFVRADSTPFAEAITTTAPAGEPGAVEFAGVRTTSTSGLVDGKREARAVTEIAEVVLGGAVRLTNLRWEAIHRSDAAGEELTGSFTMGSASVNGEPIPTNDPAEAIAALNQVLNGIGLNLRVPTSRTAPGPNGNIQFVDPLAIQVVPNPTRDGITGPLLEGAQPARESLFQAFLDATCDAATYITIFDIVLGSLTGAGSFNLEFGGVQAETRAIRFSSSLGGRPTLGLGNSGSLGGTSVAAGGTGRGASTATRTVNPATSPGSSQADEAAQPAAGGGGTSGLTEPIADVAGERGGALALVGATGLLLLLASAEADRRKMRRAQREIPVGV